MMYRGQEPAIIESRCTNTTPITAPQDVWRLTSMYFGDKALATDLSEEIESTGLSCYLGHNYQRAVGSPGLAALWGTEGMGLFMDTSRTEYKRRKSGGQVLELAHWLSEPRLLPAARGLQASFDMDIIKGWASGSVVQTSLWGYMKHTSGLVIGFVFVIDDSRGLYEVTVAHDTITPFFTSFWGPTRFLRATKEGNHYSMSMGYHEVRTALHALYQVHGLDPLLKVQGWGFTGLGLSIEVTGGGHAVHGLNVNNFEFGALDA